jgi:L-lactate dehydrogenase complex protein LldG
MNARANNNARDAILSSIRENLAASLAFDALHHEHEKESSAHIAKNVAADRSVDLDANRLTEIFRENLVSVGGHCVVVGNELAAARAIQEIVAKTGARRIAISDSHVVQNLCSSISGDVEVLKNAASADLFRCNLGITSAQYAIAETGTLALESERERNRLASLVPPIHICILDARDIHARMIDVLNIVQTSSSKTLSRAITFITGPSRTSDIELTLAIGVHGPRELHVIVMNNA